MFETNFADTLTVNIYFELKTFEWEYCLFKQSEGTLMFSIILQKLYPASYVYKLMKLFFNVPESVFS